MASSKALRIPGEWRQLLLTAVRYFCLISAAGSLRKILKRYLQFRRFHRFFAHVPAPNVPHHPLLGLLPEVLRNRHRILDWRLEHTIGAGRSMLKIMFPIFMFNGQSLWVTDPSSVKHILKDRFDIYTKTESTEDHMFASLTELLGRGIFTVTHGRGAKDGGKLWTSHRKVALKIFSRKNFNLNMGRVFQAKGAEFQRFLFEHAGASAGSNGGARAFDIQKMFFSFTMDSIMEIFFGQRSDINGDTYEIIANNFDEAHRAMVVYTVTSISKLTLLELFPYPLGGHHGILVSLHRKFNTTSKTFRECTARIDREVMQLIQERRTQQNLDQCSDLLALFMRSEDPTTGQPFSDRALRDMVLNFLIAGRDTTASALTWLFYELSLNQEIQQRLANEVAEALPNGTPLSFESVMSLPYLNGAVYEALRLHPPVPINFKLSKEDDYLPDGTAVPKGTRLWYMPYVMGRDPARYANPSEFKPERWIPFKEPASHEFPQFQSGPRICIGKEMAIYEIKLMTAMLLQEFSFSLKDGEAENITYSNGITMSLCNSKTQDSFELWLHAKARTPRL